MAAGGPAVRSLAVSADGKLAATGDASGAIKLWDLATLKEPRTLSGHAAAVTGIALIDGGKVVSVSEDKTVRLWNVADGARTGQDRNAGGGNVASHAARRADRHGTCRQPDSPLDAAGRSRRGDCRTRVRSPDILVRFRAWPCSPAEKPQLVSGSADGMVRVWNLEDNKQLREIEHGAAVTAVAVRPDGKQLASAGADNQIKLWNAADGAAWASPDKRAIAELKGDFAAQFKVAQIDRRLAFVSGQATDDKKVAGRRRGQDHQHVAGSRDHADRQGSRRQDAEGEARRGEAGRPTPRTRPTRNWLPRKTPNTAAADAAAKAKAAAEADAANADLAKANEAADAAAAAADAAVKEAEKKVGEAKAAARQGDAGSKPRPNRPTALPSKPPSRRWPT